LQGAGIKLFAAVDFVVKPLADAPVAGMGGEDQAGVLAVTRCFEGRDQLVVDELKGPIQRLASRFEPGLTAVRPPAAAAVGQHDAVGPIRAFGMGHGRGPAAGVPLRGSRRTGRHSQCQRRDGGPKGAIKVAHDGWNPPRASAVTSPSVTGSDEKSLKAGSVSWTPVDPRTREPFK